MTHVAMIGYGEVGGIFAAGLRRAGIERITVHDTAPAVRARAAGTEWRGTHEEAARGADLVIVAVTAGSALEAVRALAPGLAPGAFVLDVNSVAPATKQAAAEVVGRAGGRYVEAAVMTSVPPRGLASPMLLGGPHVDAFMAMAAPWGMALTAYSGRIGAASSVKMCRSIMVKGLEALAVECLLTARHYGVEQDVLASLGDTLPHPDWPGLARYMIGRALQHGRRRAEEMREVARTVEGAGLDPLLSAAIARRQDWAADRKASMAAAGPDLASLLDAVLAFSEDEVEALVAG